MALNYPDLQLEVEQIKSKIANNLLDDADINAFNKLTADFMQQLQPGQEDFRKQQYKNGLDYYQKLNTGRNLLKEKLVPHEPLNTVPGLSQSETDIFRNLANTSAEVNTISHTRKLNTHYEKLRKTAAELNSLSPTESQNITNLIDELYHDPAQYAAYSNDPNQKKYADYAKDYIAAYEGAISEQAFVYGRATINKMNPTDFVGLSDFIKLDQQALSYNAEQLIAIKNLTKQGDTFHHFYTEANNATPNDIQTYNKKSNKAYKRDPNGNLVYSRYDKTWGGSNFLEFKQFELKKLQYQENGLEFTGNFEFKKAIEFVPDELNDNQKVKEPNKALLLYDDYKDRAALAAKEEMESAKARLTLSTIALKKNTAYYQSLTPTEQTLFSTVVNTVSDHKNNTVKQLTPQELASYGPQQAVAEAALAAANSIKQVNDANRTIYGFKNAPLMEFDVTRMQEFALHGPPFNITNPSTKIEDILSPKSHPTAVNGQSPNGNPQSLNQDIQGRQNLIGNRQTSQPSQYDDPSGMAALLSTFAGGVGYVAGVASSTLVKSFWDGVTHPIDFINTIKSNDNPSAMPLPKLRVNPLIPNANEPVTKAIAAEHQVETYLTDMIAYGGTGKMMFAPSNPLLPNMVGHSDIFTIDTVKSVDDNEPLRLSINNMIRKEKQLGLIRKKGKDIHNPLVRLTDAHNEIIRITHAMTLPEMKPFERDIALLDLCHRFEQIDQLLNDDKNGLLKKMSNQVDQPDNEVRAIGIANASIINSLTNNIKKTVEFGEQNNLYDPHSLKMGRDGSKTPFTILDSARNNLDSVAHNVVALFNKITAAVNKVMTPNVSQPTASPTP